MSPGSPSRTSDSGAEWLKPTDRTTRRGDFHHGCCNCFDDCGLCLYGFFCTPCLGSQNSADLDSSPQCCFCWYPGAGIGNIKTRRQARAQFNLMDDSCNDCFITYFCGWLGEIQVAKEIKYQKQLQQQSGPINFPLDSTSRVNSWKHGLCGCFGDCGICIYGYFCFTCLATQNSADLDGNPNDCGCCYPTSIAKNRAQALSQFGIHSAGYCNEFMICAFCTFCSEIQIARELKWHRENAVTNMRGSGPKVQEMKVGAYQPPSGGGAPLMMGGQQYDPAQYQQQQYGIQAQPVTTWTHTM